MNTHHELPNLDTPVRSKVRAMMPNCTLPESKFRYEIPFPIENPSSERPHHEGAHEYNGAIGNYFNPSAVEIFIRDADDELEAGFDEHGYSIHKIEFRCTSPKVADGILIGAARVRIKDDILLTPWLHGPDKTRPIANFNDDGYHQLINRTIFVESIYIRADLRNRGLAPFYLNEALEALKPAGAQRVSFKENDSQGNPVVQGSLALTAELYGFKRSSGGWERSMFC